MMQFNFNFHITCLSVFTVFIAMIFFKKKVKSKLFVFEVFNHLHPFVYFCIFINCTITLFESVL